jgi:hypothetical protein
MDSPWEKFYVFYDENDNIICCGTGKELVERKYFKDKNVLQIKACRLKQGKAKGSVVVMPVNETK